MSKQRALAITLDLCGSAEESAEQQSEVKKQQALDNWFFEKSPEKPGNKRLKNLKRWASEKSPDTFSDNQSSLTYWFTIDSIDSRDQPGLGSS